MAGAWSSIQTPTTVKAFALSPGAPGRIVVSDGQSVYGTIDEGCSWSRLLTLPALPSVEFPLAEERVLSVAAPTPDDLYLALSGPHVVVSRDGGATWTTSDAGLVGRGEPVEIVAAARDAGVLYMPVITRVGDQAVDNGYTPSTDSSLTVTQIFRSADEGRTWSRAGAPAVGVEGPRLTKVSKGTLPGVTSDLAVSPSDPHRLWAATSEGLFTSADGGESWDAAIERTDAVAGLKVRAVDVLDGGPIEVIAVDPASGMVYTNPDSDGSVGWTARRFVGLQTAYSMYDTVKGAWLAHSGDGTIIATGPKGVFRRNGARSWSDVSPVSLDSWASALVDVAAVPNGDMFYGRPKDVGTSLFRYDASYARAGRSSTSVAGSVDNPLRQLSQHFGPVAPSLPARLQPARATLRLRPGERATKTYRLSLPPRPTPIDVFFLLDSTESMSGVIRALARSVAAIVSDVRAGGVDVWAGVGEFRTYPYPGEESFNFPYRRDLPVGPPGPKLSRALLGMESGGASGANLAALTQAVTGAGQEVLPPGSSAGDIESGLDAGFRPGAISVIVHAADSPFGTPERGSPDAKFPPPAWPGPGFDAATGALKAAGVLQVGAAIGFGTGVEPPSGSANALSDLRRVAEDSDTLALNAIDCDGDGNPDVAAGEPLVCPIQAGDGTDLAPAIVSLLDGIRDEAPVRMVATSGGDVVETIAPALYPRIDVKRPHELTFEVTYRCPSFRAALHYSVDLQALVRDDRVAGARAEIDCVDRVPRRKIVPPRASDVRPVVGALPLLPPPPPPPPVNPGPANAPAPQPQPQPNLNPNAQPQPQPVPVAQRQQQPQVVLVQAAHEVREQAGMQYAMASLHSTPQPLETVKLGLAAGAMSIVLLYGYATVAVRAVRRRSSFH